jgi:glutathione S-transferase
MIKLYQFPPVWGRNVSPFTLKLETWLKLAGLSYEVVPVRNPGRGPKGKMPFIEDQDGQVIGDSSLIIEHLERTRGLDLNRGLAPIERVEALALQRLIEDHFYFILVYSRWCDADGWHAVAPAFFDFLPVGLRQIVPLLVRRRVRASLHHQGLGRHSRDELYDMAWADLEAMSIMLDNRPFFFGERPTTIDAVAYGFLANVLLVPVETELKRIAAQFSNLQGWTAAMERHYGNPPPEPEAATASDQETEGGDRQPA